MIKKELESTGKGIKISFLGEVKKQQIVTMVQNCSTGRCECMSDETKAKIENMKVSGEDGSVDLELEGDIGHDEIRAALDRSKVIN